MNWNSVGKWISANAGTGAKLIGSLVTGGVPAAIATGVSLITSATGTDDPDEALQILKDNPESVLKLKELAFENEKGIRDHLREMTELEYTNAQHMHTETQTTIRAGDVALDKEIRWTRPNMAKESWFATIAYGLGCFGVQVITGIDYYNITVAGIFASPAFAYLGLRTGDKFALAWQNKKSNN